MTSETHDGAQIAFEKLNQVSDKKPWTQNNFSNSEKIAVEKTKLKEELAKEELWCVSHVLVISCNTERTFLP